MIEEGEYALKCTDINRLSSHLMLNGARVLAGENKFQTWISVHWYTNHRNKQVQFQHSIIILFLVDLGLLILELQRLSVIAVLKELWLVKYIFFYYIISCINDFIFNMCSVLFIIYRNSPIENKHISWKWERSVSN